MDSVSLFIDTKNEDAREHWWQIWRKKKDVPDRSLYYLAFVAGWNASRLFNKED